MPKINIRLKKQAIKLHLVRSVHLDARMIFPYERFFIRATSCTLRELILWVLKIIVKRNLLRRKQCC